MCITSVDSRKGKHYQRRIPTSAGLRKQAYGPVITGCCHSLYIAPKRFLFPSMFSPITADNGDYIGFAVGFAMYYHTAKLRIPIF